MEASCARLIYHLGVADWVSLVVVGWEGLAEAVSETRCTVQFTCSAIDSMARDGCVDSSVLVLPDLLSDPGHYQHQLGISAVLGPCCCHGDFEYIQQPQMHHAHGNACMCSPRWRQHWWWWRWQGPAQQASSLTAHFRPQSRPRIQQGTASFTGSSGERQGLTSAYTQKVVEALQRGVEACASHLC